MRASEWRVLALRLGMWDMIGFWQVHLYAFLMHMRPRKRPGLHGFRLALMTKPRTPYPTHIYWR
jgi:hypothetical protein